MQVWLGMDMLPQLYPSGKGECLLVEVLCVINEKLIEQIYDFDCSLNLLVHFFITPISDKILHIMFFPIT